MGEDKIKSKTKIRRRDIILFLGSLLLVASCSSKQNIFVKYSNPQIEFSGRVDSTQEDGLKFYWMGNSARINFEGNSVFAELKDESGYNYFNIILDNDSIRILRPDTIRKQYLLASGLSNGKHSIELFKRNNKHATTFYGFKINGRPKLLAKSPPKNRKIMFYGNSITAGSSVEDYSGRDLSDSTYTNNYFSYSAITARHYNAEYTCISKSGIGIMVSWFPIIMPEMYNRLNPRDSARKWNFINDNPDVVVINLFQNDSWLIEKPEHPQFKARFGKKAPDEKFIINAYKNFVSIIRSHYPEASIICILGNMDVTKKGSNWSDYVKQAVNALNDDKIYTHFIPFKRTSGHPNIEEQEALANSLIQFIDQTIEW